MWKPNTFLFCGQGRPTLIVNRFGFVKSHNKKRFRWCANRAKFDGSRWRLAYEIRKAYKLGAAWPGFACKLKQVYFLSCLTNLI